MISFKEVYMKSNFPDLIKSPITRVQISEYAGASGDFNPIHIDEEFAKKSPLESVIAHGMLSMGFLGQYTEQLAGDKGEVKVFKVQFRTMVRPGDTISCKAKQMSLSDNEIIFEIKAVNQNGEVVAKGETRIERK